MAKLAFVVLVFCSSLITMQKWHCTAEEQKENDDRLQKLTTAGEKVTHLHFYLHQIPTAPNPTSVVVAKGVNSSQTFFATLVMIDDLLTEGPKPTSKPVGRAQGLVGSAGLDKIALCMSFNFVFTSGKFNGSSLAVLGRNEELNPTREMPIVGGTGAFLLARGFLTTTTYALNTTTRNAIYEYNVVAIHF